MKKHSKQPLPVGTKFGRWTIINNDAGRTPTGMRLNLCRCECGKEGKVVTAKLKSGWSKSCGCYNVDHQRALHLRHGMADTPTHNTWVKIRDRCRNPKNAKYADYGGRGIKVCARWNVFENFLADMGVKPGPSFSIDRYPNNDGDYEPGNCRWATPTQQANNRRNRGYSKWNPKPREGAAL